MQKSIDTRLQKYKKNRLLGMNKYNAAVAAGFSKNTALNSGKRLDERAKIYDILERQGLTDRVLAIKHKELLDASQELIIDGQAVGIKRPEYQVQIKALELAYRLKELLRDKVEHSGTIEHSHFYKEIISKPILVKRLEIDSDN